MNTMHKAVMILAIGISATAQAQQVIHIEGQRYDVDPSALVGEDSGSFYLSRQTATWASLSTTSPAARRSDMSLALISEDSGSSYFASLPQGPGVDRAVVVAELDRARASGELGALVSEDSGSAWLARRTSAMSMAAMDAIRDGAERHSGQRVAVAPAGSAR